jgi:hypothetical protein
VDVLPDGGVGNPPGRHVLEIRVEFQAARPEIAERSSQI